MRGSYRRIGGSRSVAPSRLQQMLFLAGYGEGHSSTLTNAYPSSLQLVQTRSLRSTALSGSPIRISRSGNLPSPVLLTRANQPSSHDHGARTRISSGRRS